jgi:hypothetical protein
MSDIDKENWNHEYNLVTGYCIHCGLAMVHECDPPLPCHRYENVTAISHIVRKIYNGIRSTFTDRNSNSD